MGEPSQGTPPSVRQPEDRLDSWKEVAAYLNRDVTTVQRWEKREGMPVHRHLHDRMGSVYASRADFWRNPIADARFQTVTDFDGAAEGAAVSRDGQFVAFLSDRDGQVDVWVTQVG